MDLALSTLFCLNRPLEEIFPDLIVAGTKCIELVDAGQHTLTQPRVDRLLELKSSYGLSYGLHAPFTDVNLSAVDPQIREAILERVETSIRWASALDARILVFHPGNSTAAERFTPGSAWKLNIDSIRRLIGYAEDYGIEAMVENMPEPFPYVLKSVEDFERFFEEVGMNVRMTLDVAHANLRGETLKFVRRFSKLIGHVHVSDNDGDADAHIRVGGGSIDWGATFSALKASGLDVWVTVESYNGVKESLRLLERLI